MIMDMMNVKRVKNALYAAAFLTLAGMAHGAQGEREDQAAVAGDAGKKKEGFFSRAKSTVRDMKKSAAQKLPTSLPKPVVTARNAVKGAAGVVGTVGVVANALFVEPLKCAIMEKKLEYTKEKLEEQSGRFDTASLKFRAMAADAEQTLTTLNKKCPSNKDDANKKGIKNIVCSLRTKLLEGQKGSYISLAEQSEKMKKAVDKQVEDIRNDIGDLQMRCSEED